MLLFVVNQDIDFVCFRAPALYALSLIHKFPQKCFDVTHMGLLASAEIWIPLITAYLLFKGLLHLANLVLVKIRGA